VPVGRRARQFEQFAPQSIQDIRREVGTVLRDACGVNSLGWMLYLFPLALAALFYGRMRSTLDEITNLQREDAKRLFTDDMELAA
jgi:hypothetical protein